MADRSGLGWVNDALSDGSQALLTKFLDNIVVPDGFTMSVADLVAEGVAINAAWMKEDKIAAAQALIDRYVRPDWGNQPVTALTVDTLAAWFDRITSTGGVDKKAAHNLGQSFMRGLELLRVMAQYPGEKVLAAFPDLEPEWEQTQGVVAGPQPGPVLAGNAVSAAREAKYGRQGAPGSIAMAIPDHCVTIKIYVTDRHLSMVVGRTWRWQAWTFVNIPRSMVAGVEKVPRLRILKRIGIRFTDGSVARFFVLNHGVVDGLTRYIGED